MSASQLTLQIPQDRTVAANRARFVRVLAVAFASLLATTANAETQVVVLGRIDHERLRERLASELATDIALSNAACNAPCLSIRIAGSSATVTYSPRTGGLRERTIALGNDEAQWPTVIALSASNLVDGLQLGGIVASAGSSGLQIGGVVASAGSSGVQIGGVTAYSRGTAGLQLGGLASVAQNATAQVSGVASVARGTTNTQIAGITTVAGQARLQIAGLVNIVDHLRGLQIGPINVAHDGDGVQVGVINIGGSEKSFSFGLINIVPGGRYDLEASIDSSRVGTVLFRHGGNRWHNVYGIGGEVMKNDASPDRVWMYGLGFGPSWRAYSTRIDLELLGWWVNHGARHSTDVSVLGQLRLSIAYDVGPVAIVAGAAFNMYFSNDQMSPFLTAHRPPGEMLSTTTDDVLMARWLSGFIGFRL